MSEIQRYEYVTSRLLEPDGECVLFTDHAAAVAARDEEIAKLKWALRRWAKCPTCHGRLVVRFLDGGNDGIVEDCKDCSGTGYPPEVTAVLGIGGGK